MVMIRDRASDAMTACIDNCIDCARVCRETLAYCIDKGGRHVSADHIKALLDCIDTCDTSARLMERGSAVHGAMCGVCAEACLRCAESCETFADDEAMQDCATVCRECAESCREMARAA